MRGRPQGREDPGVGAGPLVHPTRPRPRPLAALAREWSRGENRDCDFARLSSK